MFKCGDRVIVKRDIFIKGQEGICLGNTYKGRYVMVQFNRDDYYYSTWIQLKDLCGFVVLCAGIL